MLSVIWKVIVLYFSALILLRISGRKSVAQMTIGTTVVMISIGAVIVDPLVDKGIGKTVLVMAIFVAVLILTEYLQMKIQPLETWLVGKPAVIIENGTVRKDVLRRMRLTEEKVNMRLRRHGISKVSDVQVATIEPNGDLGYELMPDARPLTVGEFKRLMGSTLSSSSGKQTTNSTPAKSTAGEEGEGGNLFRTLSDGSDS